VAPIAHSGGRQAAEVVQFPEHDSRHLLDRRALFLDGHGIFVAERLAQPLFARETVRRPHLQFIEPQRIGAELLHCLYQLPVESGDDGGHRDHRGGADQHPEDGEKRPELVSAQGVERQREVLTNTVPVSHHRNRG